MGFVDDMLPYSAYDVLVGGVVIVGVVVLLCVINYWIAIAIVPLVFLFVLLRKHFLMTSREVKRIEANARSPVYSLFSTSLTGLATLRASKGGIPRFERTMEESINTHGRTMLTFISASRSVLQLQT